MHCENDLVSNGVDCTHHPPTRRRQGSTSTLFSRDEVRRLVDLPPSAPSRNQLSGPIERRHRPRLAKRFVHDGVGCDLDHLQLVDRPLSLCTARVGYLGSRNRGSQHAADLRFQAGTRVALVLSSFHCHSSLPLSLCLSVSAILHRDFISGT